MVAVTGKVLRILPFKVADEAKKVVDLIIADESDHMRVSLWDDKAKLVNSEEKVNIAVNDAEFAKGQNFVNDLEEGFLLYAVERVRELYGKKEGCRLLRCEEGCV